MAYDIDTIEAMEEQGFCCLIHNLLKDIKRLEAMVADTREEVNALLPKGEPRYDLTWENVINGCYWNDPAMERYLEVFEGHAIIPWEE
jgi:hypothetical protein